MHLVGFILGIYHDALSSECQIGLFFLIRIKNRDWNKHFQFSYDKTFTFLI